MNTADERLRAAAREAARIFPTGGELLPLRLPNLASGHRWGRRRAAIGTGRTRAWLSPLAAAAAVATIAVVAGLVSAQLSKPAGSSGAIGRGPVVKLTNAQIAVLTGTAKGPWVTYALGENAVQTVTERCMHARGVVYYPFFERPADAATMATQVPGVPGAAIGLAARQANGYGFYSKGVRHATHPGAEGRPDKEAKYVASLPAGERQRYLLVLNGPRSRKLSVTIPGLGPAGQFSAGGCLAAARRQVYGSLANFVLVTVGWGQLQGHLKPVQADPAFSAVISKWSACMADHGYQYPGPDNLWNRLGVRVYSSPTPAHRALEIRTAVQDYKCSQAVRLIPTIKALQVNRARYVSKAVAHDLSRITRIFAHALEVARRLHLVS